MGRLTGLGGRLKEERERLGLNQLELAQFASVNRNSQSAYETAKTPPTVEYLFAIENAGVDLGYLLWGVRGGLTLSQVQVDLLACFNAAGASERAALLTVAYSFAKRPAPPAQITLPSADALEDAMSGLLDEAQDYSPAELVHEIATQLPIILQAAQHEIAAAASDRHDSEREPAAATGGEQPSTRQGRRT